MRLLRATVRNYRAHRELAVEFDRAVTLLVGPNEVGKSTFLEAVHRGLLLFHRRGGKELASMQSSHGGDPEVEVSFVADGSEWHLHKVFRGSSGSVCRLRNVRTGKLLEKDDAETELQRLLGRAKVATTENELSASWDHLWVWQGRGGEDVFAAPDAVALQAALARRAAGASGGVAEVGSARDRQLLAAARAAVATNWTDRSQKLRSDGEASRLRAHAEALAAQQQAAQTRFTARTVQRQRLQEVQRLVGPLAVDLAANEAALAAVAQRVAARQQKVDGLAGLRERHAAAAQRRDELAKERQARAELAGLLVVAEAAATAATADAGAASQQLGEARAAAAAAQAATRTAEAAGEAAAQRRRTFEQRRQLQDAERRLAALAQAVAEFAAAKADADAAAAELAAAVPVTEARLRALQEAQHRRDRLEAQLDAAAARIVHVAGAKPVQVDDTPLAPGESRRIDRPTRLVHADGTVLEVRPGGDAVANLRTELQQVRADFDAALVAVGAADLAAAQRLHERWRAAQRRAELADAALVARRDPSPERAEVAARAEVLRERLGNAALPGDGEGDDEAVRAAEAAAIATLAAARQVAQQAELRRAAAEQQAHDRRDVAEQRRREVVRLQAQRDASHGRFGSDESLAAAWHEAAGKADELAAAITALAGEERSLQDDRQQGAALERGGHGLRDRLATLRTEAAGLSAVLQQEGEDLAAAVERLSDEHARAAAAAAAAQRRADADLLLLQTLLGIEAELRTRREAPYLDACARYLAIVFGDGARLHLAGDKRDGKLGTVDRAGAGLGAFDFAALSCGGRELVALAARLAMAEVLAAEQPDGCVPVVLDDALTNVDPERAARIGYLLDHAAAHGVQVIVASCDTERVGQWLAGTVHTLARRD